MNHYVDVLTADRVAGWILLPDKQPSLHILVDGRHVGDAILGIPRPDVQAHFPDSQAALQSGFEYVFQPADFSHCKSAIAKVAIVITPENSPPVTLAASEVPVLAAPSRLEISGLARQLLSMAPAPFPVGVASLLLSLRGGSPKVWTAEAIDAAIEDLAFIVNSGPRTLAPLDEYLGYVAQMWTKHSFVERRFPRINAGRQARAKDADCVGSSAMEMFAISHYLYVIKSYDIRGNLAEFGCFKGFSTSCLSQACHELQMRIDVFDSFAGLPPSDSTYYSPGDFAGSLEEVKENIATFGNLPAVNFHKGFFADSLKSFPTQPLACLWMDVDLASSARDVMGVFPMLSERSCLFSHECTASNFVEGEIVSPEGPDRVIPAIKASFSAAGRTIAGRHIHGCTGAFWDKNSGVPPLSAPQLSRIRDIALPQFQDLQEMDQRMRELDQRLREINQQLGERDQQIREKDNQLEETRQQLQQRQVEFDSVLQSRSWRITAPLRRARQTVRSWARR